MDEILVPISNGIIMRESESFRRTTGDSLRRLSIAIIVLHAIVTVAHSAAHMSLKKQ